MLEADVFLYNAVIFLYLVITAVKIRYVQYALNQVWNHLFFNLSSLGGEFFLTYNYLYFFSKGELMSKLCAKYIVNWPLAIYRAQSLVVCPNHSRHFIKDYIEKVGFHFQFNIKHYKHAIVFKFSAIEGYSIRKLFVKLKQNWPDSVYAICHHSLVL